jgi:hypothetical protein
MPCHRASGSPAGSDIHGWNLSSSIVLRITGDTVATASECTNTEDKLKGTERGMVAEVVQLRWINMRQLGPKMHRKNVELAARTSCINVFVD